MLQRENSNCLIRAISGLQETSLFRSLERRSRWIQNSRTLTARSACGAQWINLSRLAAGDGSWHPGTECEPQVIAGIYGCSSH